MIQSDQPILKLFALVDQDNLVVTYIQSTNEVDAINFAKNSLDDVYSSALNNPAYTHLADDLKKQYVTLLCNRLNNCFVVELCALKQLELIVNEKIEPLYNFGGVYKHDI